ncbi:MAG TPA: cytochrome c biogenesis protein CcdA [Nitrospirales bacterium]|nr:cytochrome c biogenesis protein CcdA [Nitrospirales bacterium]HIO21165.1 cytochrome c biogenesis protein CcdA [Nitrospirales bacterium]
MFEPEVSFTIAFVAGFLSFISPCVLPLVPSYLSYITGLSLDQLTSEDDRRKLRGTIMMNSLLFIGGFSFVFMAFGASASFAGQLLFSYHDYLQKIGGVLIIIFGLYVMGIFKLKFLAMEKRIQLPTRPAGYVGSVLIGMVFGAAWTPCVGPILGSILALAATSDSMMAGVQLLGVYSLGLGIPLFVTALGVDSFLNYFKKVRAYMWAVSATSGVFLVLVGVMIYTNSFSQMTRILTDYGIGWYVGPDAAAGSF